MSAVNSLDPSDIQIGERLRRTLNREVVNRLKELIAKIGLKTPISVQYRGDEEGFFLVAGRHRLQACIELGWTDIPVLEEGSSSLDARMWEIAENLHRADLTALERDEHIAEWIRLSDETKVAQVAPPGGRQPLEQGIRAAARELGIERTQAQRAQKVAGLDDETKEEAKALGLDNNQSALLKAARAPSQEEQIASLRDHAASRATPKAQSPLNDPETVDRQVDAIMPVQDAAALSLPAALAQVLRNHGVSVDDVGPFNEVIAETIQDVMRTIESTMGIGLDNDDPDDMPVLAALGGPNYIQALNDWDLACFEWKQNRSRKKGPRPEPPPVPVR